MFLITHFSFCFIFFIRDIADFYVINNIRYEEVTILPEIVLNHPIFGTYTNSYSKLRSNAQMKLKLLKYESASLTWPTFVYNLYNVENVIKRIQFFLTTLKIGEQKI